MFRVVCMLFVLWPVILTGCGGSEAEVQVGVPTDIPPAAPLSLEEWNAITDVNEKYDIATLERLRASDPQLESEKGWNQFMKEVVGPKMKAEMPIRPQH
ncbi:hypothetical protein [Gimesia algae]|uniref:Uncharacterized protein n=1 Tax=Gimesia algae TaxID=2527971 RepID=A0A517V9E4_9PLAN|nr:hypothetical protein [Gimesia algae]QDT89617.1 hypothetical protein Pan161_12490 [Gimesia algae]